MLKSIKIQNFKAIKEPALELNNLASVNYLVGKNGSGKSSVLEALFEFDLRQIFNGARRVLTPWREITMIQSIINSKYLNSYPVWEQTEISISDYNTNNSGLSREINSEIISFTGNQVLNRICIFEFDSNTHVKLKPLSSCIESIFPPESKIGTLFNKLHDITNIDKIDANSSTYTIDPYLQVPKDKSSLNELANWSSGNKSLINFITNLWESYKANSIYIDSKSTAFNDQSNKFQFNHAHDLDYVICLIDEPENSLHPDYQKLIPEILAEFTKITNNKVQFIISTHSPFIISAAASLPDQKVYLIDDGKCTNPEGESGYGAKKQANELLGIGFEDYHHKIVICEGSPSKEFPGLDAEVYNTIFWDKEYLFVSAGGETQLGSNSELAKKVIKNIFKDSGAISFYLKDGDGKSPKAKEDESSKNQINFGSPLKFTNRYSLECYLFDPEVIKIKFPDKAGYQGIFDEWKKQCWNNGKYDHGKEPRLALIEHANAEKLHLELAKLINPTDTPIVYNELYNCIFGEL